MFAAVLDTCVLWPSLQRDFLLSMAIEGLYRPLWSEAILEELHRHEQLKLRDRGTPQVQAQAAADRLLHNMRLHFDDALVTGWEPLEGTFGFPDIDDEHVVAAAVVGGAGAIVTDNLRDFQAAAMPHHVQVLSARDFAANTADVDPQRAARALVELSERRKAQTPEELLALLVTRYGMDEVADILGPTLDDLMTRGPDEEDGPKREGGATADLARIRPDGRRRRGLRFTQPRGGLPTAGRSLTTCHRTGARPKPRWSPMSDLVSKTQMCLRYARICRLCGTEVGSAKRRDLRTAHQDRAMPDMRRGAPASRGAGSGPPEHPRPSGS